MKKEAVILLLMMTNVFLRAETPVFDLSLSTAESEALSHSPLLAAADRDTASAHKDAAARRSALWPALTLDGTWRYVTEVPSLTIAGKTMGFGDNNNYSVGPAIRWTVWDGALRSAKKSAEAAARAKDADQNAARKQILLSVRTAYFQTQGAMEQVSLLAESLRMAQDQNADIQHRVRAGAASRLDGLLAHQDVLTRRAQLRQARADASTALRELTALTGRSLSDNDLLPLDAATAKKVPADVEPPTLIVSMDPLDRPQHDLAEAAEGQPGAGHPRVAVISAQIDAARFAAQGAAAGHWPKIQASAKTSLDYPNGPVLEQVHQNTVGASASLSLFEFNRVARETTARNEQVAALEFRRNQTEEDLRRDWVKARDQRRGLIDQRRLFIQRAEEAEEYATLIYDAYEAGQSRFLDVQAANLRALEAKIQSALTEIRISSQMAILAYLSETDPSPATSGDPNDAPKKERTSQENP
jgi:outer membrane protein TolC